MATSGLELEYAMTYVVLTTNVLDPTTNSPWGVRQYFQVSEASLDGPGIKAKLAATGIDWMGVGDDGFYRPDLRAQFLTDDGAVVLMHYTGLVQQTARDGKAAQVDTPGDWADRYWRMSVRFETGAPRYAWLNTSLFVSRGRRLSEGRFEYEIYRVT